MKIDIKNLIDKGSITINESIDFSSEEIADQLIEKILTIKVNCQAFAVNDYEFNLNLDYQVNLIYLDARDLKPLELSFNYSDNVMFTSDFQNAKDLDIDYVKEEINIDELIFALAIVNLPINYSEGKKLPPESVPIENKPFAKVFNQNQGGE